MGLKNVFILIFISGICHADNSWCMNDNEPCLSYYDDNSGKTVYNWVEEMAHYPGHEQELFRYIHERLIIPPLDITTEMPQTKVISSFIINVDGSITHVNIMERYTEPDNENDAGQRKLRKKDANAYTPIEKMIYGILSNMPPWIPAKCNGENVPMLFSLPIHIDYGR